LGGKGARTDREGTVIEYFDLPALAAVLMIIPFAVVRLAGKLIHAWQQQRTIKELVEHLHSRALAGELRHKDADGAEWIVTILPARREWDSAIQKREKG
jgi:hypothetical protein